MQRKGKGAAEYAGLSLWLQNQPGPLAQKVTAGDNDEKEWSQAPSLQRLGKRMERRASDAGKGRETWSSQGQAQN